MGFRDFSQSILKKLSKSISIHAFILFPLILLSSCLDSFKLEVVNQNPTLQIELVSQLGFVPLTQMSSYPVKGKCSKFTNVTVNVDGDEVVTPCTNGRFQANFNLSGKSEGTLSIHVSGVTDKNETISQVSSIIKDTVVPSAALVISGMGSAFSNNALPRSITILTTQDDYFYKTKLINSGTCAAVNFNTVASSSLTFLSLNLVANQNNTLCVLSSDRAGNWRVSAVSSDTVFLDTIIPSLTFTQSSVAAPPSTSLTVNWRMTEANPDVAQNMILEYSATGSNPWDLVDQRTVGPGSITNQAYSFAWTTPVTTAAGKLRLRYTDLAGNNNATEMIDAYIDSGSPVLNAIVVAEGNTVVGLPTVRVQTDATASISPITHVMISEDSGFTGGTWVAYNNGDVNFRLSLTAGPKTVYVKVRSASGQESNVLNSSLTLDIGNPPVMRILSPLAGTAYAPGQTVNISWECSTTSIVGLDPVPVKSLQYSVDDGLSYHIIASNRTNNDSATQGSYSWTIPSVTPTGQSVTSTKPLRIMGYCSAASGVVSSGMSDLLNSVWKVLAGEPGNLEVGIHGSLADIRSESGFFGDSANNIYYAGKNAIMKMDGKSGLLSRWLGQRETAGCTLASGDVGYLSTPMIMDISAQDEILIYSQICSRLYKINIATKAIIWSRTFALELSGESKTETRVFYLKTGYLFFIRNQALYRLNLNSSSSTPEHLAGTPGVCGSFASDGTPATSSSFQCSLSSSTHHPTVSFDMKKIWVSTNGATLPKNIMFEWDDATNQYLTKTATVGNIQRCIQTNFSTDTLFCKVALPGSTSRGVYAFNPETQTLSAVHNLGTFKNFAGQVYLGGGKSSFFAFVNTNELFEVSFNSTAFTLSSIKIAGAIFHTYGNTTGIRDVAFTRINDFAYDTTRQMMYVRGTTHLRGLHIDTSGTPFVDRIETVINSTFVPNSGPVYGLSISPDGTILATSGAASGYFWLATNPASWNAVTQTISGLTPTHFVPNNPAAVDYATFVNTPVPYNTPYVLRRDPYLPGAILPNNKLYFMAARDTDSQQDLWLFESDRSNLTLKAGAEGAVGYSPTDDGNDAFGARLKDVYGMQPVLTMPSANYGDLLIFDGPRLRRVSVTSESATPKIYDEEDFTTATNYPGDIAWDHAIYDEATGWSYFAYSGNTSTGIQPQVWAHKSGVFERITTEGLVLNKIYKRSLKLQITPMGLVLMDSNKARLIYTDLKI